MRQEGGRGRGEREEEGEAGGGKRERREGGVEEGKRNDCEVPPPTCMKLN